MKSNSDDILQKLMRKGKSAAAAQHHLSSLGVPLTEQSPGQFGIDTTRLRAFAGIATLSQMLVNDVMEQCGLGITDILVQRKVLPQLTPELHAAGVEWIMIYSRLEAVEKLPSRYHEFSRAVDIVFHCLQSERWGGLLLPSLYQGESSSHTGVALQFPFHLYSEEADYFFLVETETAGQFLRITIENAELSRIQLKHIPHRVVDNLDSYQLIPDRQQYAGQIYHGILREAASGKAEFKESIEQQPTLFEALRQGGLSQLNTIIFHWPDISLVTTSVNKPPAKASDDLLYRLLNKELLLLQDHDVLAQLNQDAVIEQTDGEWHVFFELSRHRSCLHISLQERRRFLPLQVYLDEMPTLQKTAASLQNQFAPVRLVLIHHITSEILGFLEACRQVGFTDISTFFVKYSGVVPDEYMETLLSLPEAQFRFHALQRIELSQTVRGRFRFSRQYSPIDSLRELDEKMSSRDLSFLKAMRLAAGHIFLREAAEAYHHQQKLLLIEDGGYLNPLINQFCLEKHSLRETLEAFHLDNTQLKLPPELLDAPFENWLAQLFLGGVEHTRNGYDADWEVEQRYGRLCFPVCSIAVSQLKTGPEARECAISILNATETILHRLGLLLSGRRILLLGSRGAIGAHAFSELIRRVSPEAVIGIDTKVTRKTKQKPVELSSPDQLDESVLYDIDLFLGIVGKSVLKAELLARTLIHSRHNKLIFVSGSTKTVEFIDLENWLLALQRDSAPVIEGHPIRIRTEPLRDLQTRITQGQIVHIHFEEDEIPAKTLYLLGNLTPINFLYYGIACEMIDRVLSELLQVSVGLVRHELEDKQLPRRLLAVDHEIDRDANLLQK